MNKVSGLQSDFAYLREDASRTIIGYGLNKPEDREFYEWYEVYIYKKQKGNINFKDVKDAILEDINSQTDEKILSGFVWNNINVWLSAENQRNFSETQRMAEKYGDAVLPLRFKLGENENEEAVYHTFETVEELDDFYTKAFRYVNECLNEGWQRKDNVDWEPYKEYFPEQEDID